jgi:hypothetical protein
MEKGHLRFSRLHKLTLDQLNQYAHKRGMNVKVKQGEEDFRATKALMVELANKGWTVAFKLPGEKSEGCDMLDEEAKKYLEDKDMFVLLIPPIGANMLRLFGDIVGTDATHKALAYGKVKLTMVSVSSWRKGCVPTDSSDETKERGFQCALVMSQSEREDVHKAIVVHLKRAVESTATEEEKRTGRVPQFSPKLGMTGKQCVCVCDRIFLFVSVCFVLFVYVRVCVVCIRLCPSVSVCVRPTYKSYCALVCPASAMWVLLCPCLCLYVHVMYVPVSMPVFVRLCLSVYGCTRICLPVIVSVLFCPSV